MSLIIDSDWVADYLKGRGTAVALLDSFFARGLAISIITFGEIYEGIYYGNDRVRHEAIFLRFLEGVAVLGISRAVARRFALIRGELRARGQLIPQPDLLIAATTMQHDFTLVTRNLKHFQRIPNLKLYEPAPSV